ncbi:MAG: hypothetical protein H0T42_23825, partial [Deltaproteobacteria bacterium]|nr:hypothetical protein [Deltaproteobacteria bacterium]
MSPRVAGAALALLAAIMLVVSIAGIPAGWWAGHPVRNGEAMHKKDVDVSLLNAVGCNTGGDGSCEPLQLSAGFDTMRYVELGASGLLALACLLLAGVTLAGSDRRKQVGLLVIGLAVVGAVLAGALIFMPKMATANIELPIGPGVFVFFGGIACAVLGSVLAMRPTPRLELQPPRQSFAPTLAAPPAAQPVDALAMLRESPAPDPKLSRPPKSPGGQLAGPAGPLAPPSFAPAPYTLPAAQPFAPPEDAPTVLPPTPPPSAATPFSPRPGAPPIATPPPPPDARARPASIAPPLPGLDRTKSSSPMPALPGDRFKAAGTGPGSDRPKSASVPPPSA